MKNKIEAQQFGEHRQTFSNTYAVATVFKIIPYTDRSWEGL